jgi:hypothetical protein
MRFALALLRRFGLFAHKAAHVDARFDQRLSRICTRETRRKAAAHTVTRP